MYVEVSSALMQDKIIDLLNNYEGEASFTFVKKSGLNMLFDFEGTDGETAASVAKKEIKGQDWGAGLYLRAHTVNK